MPRVRVSTQPAPPGAPTGPNPLLDTTVRALGPDLLATVSLTRDEVPRGNDLVTVVVALPRAELIKALQAGGDSDGV